MVLLGLGSDNGFQGSVSQKEWVNDEPSFFPEVVLVTFELLFVRLEMSCVRFFYRNW